MSAPSFPVLSGWLHSDGDGVRGELVDALGFVTTIVGVPEVRAGVRGYALTATVVAPDSLKLPWED